MARLFSSGVELNSLTTGVEFAGSGGTVSVQTGTVRSGTYSLRLNPAGSTNSYVHCQFATTGITADHYGRIYFRIASLPSAVTPILVFIDGTTSVCSSIRLNTDGTLQLCNVFTQVGSSSSALSLNTWYRIELRTKRVSNGNDILDGRIDGVSFASSSVQTLSNTSGTVEYLTLGYFGPNLTQDIYFDDIAVNDSTGSFQNSWPGAGQIIHLKPSAAGDNNTFSVQVGGTAGSGNNFTRVNEVPPDDATTYNADTVSNDVDDFNINDTPGSIGSTDTINVVHVGLRYSALVAALESSLKVRIKKAASGTVTKSAALTPTSTTWTSNSNSAPFPFPITLYQDPDSAAWTKATLDTAQIGYEISSGNTNSSAVSNVWLLVDSTPAAVSNTVTYIWGSDTAGASFSYQHKVDGY